MGGGHQPGVDGGYPVLVTSVRRAEPSWRSPRGSPLSPISEELAVGLWGLRENQTQDRETLARTAVLDGSGMPHDGFKLQTLLLSGHVEMDKQNLALVGLDRGLNRESALRGIERGATRTVG